MKTLATVTSSKGRGQNEFKAILKKFKKDVSQEREAAPSETLGPSMALEDGRTLAREVFG